MYVCVGLKCVCLKISRHKKLKDCLALGKDYDYSSPVPGLCFSMLKIVLIHKESYKYIYLALTSITNSYIHTYYHSDILSFTSTENE